MRALVVYTCRLGSQVGVKSGVGVPETSVKPLMKWILLRRFFTLVRRRGLVLMDAS